MPDKVRQLKKHKNIATGLFIAMAIVYFIAVYVQKENPQTWIPYVQAFSEAAMVGALADWFAVTALFRYPMGLKIPHTNLIENSKNAIGANLGSFVTENFLTPENIRPYIEKIDLAQFASQWLQQEKNQKTLKQEIANLLIRVVQDLDDQAVLGFLSSKASEGIATINVQQLASQGLLYAIDRNEHNRLIDLILPQAKNYVENNREEIYKKVTEKQPILSLVGGKAVTNQLIGGILAFFDEIQSDPKHKIRMELTANLLEITHKIGVAEDWKIKFDNMLAQFITAEKIDTYVADFWSSLKTTISQQLKDENSVLSSYIDKNTAELAQNLSHNEALRDKINLWIRYSAYRLVLHNTQEVSKLISTTVAEWDGKELSEKLELEVGKDLQFIRINGTLVGGLVGLLIYIITEFINQ